MSKNSSKLTFVKFYVPRSLGYIWLGALCHTPLSLRYRLLRDKMYRKRELENATSKPYC